MYARFQGNKERLKELNILEKYWVEILCTSGVVVKRYRYDLEVNFTNHTWCFRQEDIRIIEED